MEETPLEAISAFTPGKKKVNKRFIYLVLAVIIIISGVILYQIFGGSSKINLTQKLVPSQAPKETKTPTATLTPTPTSKKLDKSKLSITIQNGSGEEGVAGKGSDLLKGLGYDVLGTSNADNFDYTGVTIKVKSEATDYLSLLKKDLGENYTVSSATSDLDDSFSSDALVIIGK